jgi:glycosyltransferase involved in cell wall biosynthesis
VFEPSPVTVGIPAILASWRYKAPVLFWVLDLWPDSLSASGAVRANWVLDMVGALTGWIYKHCTLILVQSRAFIPKIADFGIAEAKIRYFPNWGEPVFESSGTVSDIPVLQDLPKGFRILFAGNIGEAQDFPAIIAAASHLKARSDIIWMIVGDGRKAAWAKEEVDRLGLTQTVYFLGQHPLETMPTFFAEADAFLVSLKYDPIFALTVPGKLQSYLASGKPVLAMLDGEGARVVTEAQAGLCCAAGDAAALADAGQRLAAMTEEQRMQLGTNGKTYFAKNFSRERVLAQLDEWLVDVTESNKTSDKARTTK